MSIQQHSASLEIVEDNLDLIEITQNSFHIEAQESNHFFNHDKADDTFQLSLDQNSFSFHIGELKEQSNFSKLPKENQPMPQIKVQNVHQKIPEKQDQKSLPIVQEQRKRKRRQIFEKYKQKATQNLLASPELQPVSNDLMNAFDEIFQIKSPEKNHEKELPVRKEIFKPQNTGETGFKKKQSVLFEQQNLLDYMPITFTSNNPNIQPDQPILINVQKKDQILQFKIPSNLSDPKVISSQSHLLIDSTNSFILESSVNKISMIYPQGEEVSRDSSDLETFLKSQLFKDEPLLDNTIKRADTSYKSIEISTLNPSIMISDNQHETIHNKNFILQERFTSNKQDRPQQQIVGKSQENQQAQQLITEKKNNEVFQTLISVVPRQQIVTQRVQSYAENRIPVYLREIRRRNTCYPNFLSTPNSDNFYLEQSTAFMQLLQEFKAALAFLQHTNERAYERMTVLGSLQKVLLNSLTVENFLTCGWQISYDFNQLSLLQPRQNFLRRNYSYDKVAGALSNYLHIVQYYQKCNLNLSDQRAQRKYLQVRAKFWQIEKNVKMIGEDIYLLCIVQVFPQHYYDYLEILRVTGENGKRIKEFGYARKMLAKYYNLRQTGDVLSLSEIGRAVKDKLEKMIQKAVII